MTTDPYKNMTVKYNHLNLPKHFQWLVDPLADTYQHIYITYDNSGKKLRKQVVNTSAATVYTQDYVDGLEYRTNGGGSLTLEAIYHAEGRITPLSGSNYQYEYTIKDHLGNARVSFADLNANNLVDVAGDILQENHYYPFGMNMSYGWMNNAGLIDDRHQYNGKELNDDFGLNGNDYGARWYDAAVGRYPNVDPKLEKLYPITPYNYAGSSPIGNIDICGMLQYPAGKLNQYQKDYPIFTKYLQNDLLGDVTRSETIMNALVKYSNGGLTRENIKEYLTFGKGPTVIIDEIDETVKGVTSVVDGKYRLEEGVHTLYVNKKLISALEKFGANPKIKDSVKEAYLLGAVSTLLHEFTHFGDRDNDYGGDSVEEGHEFESEVYTNEIGIRPSSSEIDIRPTLKIINLLKTGRYDTSDKTETPQPDKINPSVLPTFPKQRK